MLKHSIAFVLIFTIIILPHAWARNSCASGVTQFAAAPTYSKPINYTDLGYYRILAATPEMKLGSAKKNVEEMVKIAKSASEKEAQVVLYPELSVTGYTMQDYFLKDATLKKANAAIKMFMEQTKDLNSVFVIGAPYRTFDGRFYNVAFVISKGKILGAIPKVHRPTYGEFEEDRWFESGLNTEMMVEDEELGNFRLSTKQLFKVKDLVIGIEICEDGWATQTPGSSHALAGANVILNLSASNDRVGKDDFRRGMINQRAADNISGYVYASSGPTESTEDIVFGGHKLISDNGSMLNESELFVRESNYIIGDIDVGKLLHERQVNKTFGSSKIPEGYGPPIKIPIEPKISQLQRKIDPHPFVPGDAGELGKRAKFIITEAAVGLEERIRRSKAQNMVLGLSGGLDSTLALLICIETAKRLGWSMDRIHTFSLPGYGTSDETKASSAELAKIVGTTFQEVSIIPMAEAMLRQLDHAHTLDPEGPKDVVFENAQARARTDFLFNYGNKKAVNGIVVGTGTLSELCLGHCTFNADHQSGYNPNVSIPKTLVKWLVKWYGDDTSDTALKDELYKVYRRKMSPELLPTKNGQIAQLTEDFVGPYELHDFFIKGYLRDGFEPYKIYELARLAFAGVYSPSKYSSNEIKKWLKEFFRRFFINQFKRDDLPAGPKVGSVSLSPRGDLRLPGDLDPEAIQEVLDEIDLYPE